jgi:alkaline phosphatase D
MMMAPIRARSHLRAKRGICFMPTHKIALPSRRRLLKAAGASLAVSTLGGIARPYLSRAADRPVITHGIQSGDVTGDSAVVWSRADRPARMHVEVATVESFGQIVSSTFADVLPESDFTAKVRLGGLPSGQDIFYRIRFQDLYEPGIFGEFATGRFRTAPGDKRSVSFAWSGDQVGQGWGIDVARGGMRTYATMLRNRPDFFIHPGDHIYADFPLQAEVKLPDGEVWRNLLIEEKLKPAETLAEFRGNWKYNLLDHNLLAFNNEIPTISQWDDHEILDNWWPGEPLTLAAHLRRKYTEKNTLILMARANRAMREYPPMLEEPSEPGRVYRKISYGPLLDVFMLDMRSYRGPNGENLQTTYGPESYFLGPQQVAWLKRELLASRATWKVLANDMPLALLRIYDQDRNWGYEAIGQGEDGSPLGRELELADILSFIKHARITNTVWLTADVHYTAAHHFHPDRAAFKEFDPFWEFVSGPIHAGNGNINKIDKTFGPEVIFAKARGAGPSFSGGPADGLQFFGHVHIEGASEVMTVTLKDVEDRALWSTKLEPKFA